MIESAGRLSDGRTAQLHTVRVALAADGLALFDEAGGLIETWPFAALRLIDAQGAELRLGRSDAPEARLVVSATLRPALMAQAPRAFSRGADQLRFAALAGGLALGGAALAALIFLAIPQAAGPLARATAPEIEAQLGENVAAQLRLALRPCAGAPEAAAQAALAPLVARFAAVDDPGFPIRVHFVRAKVVNAFAAPGGHVVITRGLLETFDDPDQLAAVLAHEIGHVENRDGMVAVYRNAGLGVLLEAVTGGSGLAQQALLLAGQAAEFGHTRRQEQAADVHAIGLLDAAGLDPGALGDALAALEAADEEDASGEEDGPAATEPEGERGGLSGWLSTHPATGERIKAARAAAKPDRPAALDAAAWDAVRGACAAHD